MGRFYDGDIEGKFGVGVQPSNDADFFGVEGTEPDATEFDEDEVVPDCLLYDFSEADLPAVEEGLDECRRTLNEEYAELSRKDKEFWAGHDSPCGSRDYEAAMGVDEDTLRDFERWMCRLALGTEIAECIRKTGSCSFSAEL